MKNPSVCVEQPGLFDAPIPAEGGREARERAFLDCRPLGLRYRGKAVPEERARDACRLVRVFCERTGQRLQCFAPDGQPSESLKRVIGALTANPDVDFDRWVQTVDRTLADPWWDGHASIGVIFGPKVVEQNLARGPVDGSRPMRETPQQREVRLRNIRIQARLARAAQAEGMTA